MNDVAANPINRGQLVGDILRPLEADPRDDEPGLEIGLTLPNFSQCILDKGVGRVVAALDGEEKLQIGMIFGPPPISWTPPERKRY